MVTIIHRMISKTLKMATKTQKMTTKTHRTMTKTLIMKKAHKNDQKVIQDDHKEM